jgi:3-oxocholest-4-en-26-oyl-CoA dehydrogenase alpha subunit
VRSVLDDSDVAFLRELRDYLAGLDTADVVREMREEEICIGPAGKAFMRQLGADGWLGVGWPERFGGRGMPAVRQWLFLEELDYQRLPIGDLSMLAVGPAIAQWGTDEQRDYFLPGMLAGEIHFAGGYTEPEAGSDLAALRTRAVRQDDGGYVINGQKIFTTAAHYSSHIWLAVRTGPQEARHRAISIPTVPSGAPGVAITQLMTQAGWRTNQVFFQDVRVGPDALVGTENGGWEIITTALKLERLMPFSRLARDLDELAAAILAPRPGRRLADRRHARRVLLDLYAQTEELRVMARQIAGMIDAGDVPRAEASMFKLMRGRVRQLIAVAAMELTGPVATLRSAPAAATVGDAGSSAAFDADPGDSVAWADPDPRLCGWPERAYRASPLLRFAGGAEEIQRDIIAEHGLGLGRSR